LLGGVRRAASTTTPLASTVRMIGDSSPNMVGLRASSAQAEDEVVVGLAGEQERRGALDEFRDIGEANKFQGRPPLTTSPCLLVSCMAGASGWSGRSVGRYRARRSRCGWAQAGRPPLTTSPCLLVSCMAGASGWPGRSVRRYRARRSRCGWAQASALRAAVPHRTAPHVYGTYGSHHHPTPTTHHPTPTTHHLSPIR
jgi:hypothetical protein